MHKSKTNFLLFYVVLLITLVITLILNSYTAMYNVGLACVNLTIIYLLKYKTRINISDFSCNMIILFIFLSNYLGNVFLFYSSVPHWDKLLHFLSGIMLAIIGHETYIGPEKESSSFVTEVVFTFMFAVACAAIWEIFEFSADMFVGTNNQGNSIIDTMLDIICGTFGGFLFSIGLIFKQKYNITK